MVYCCIIWSLHHFGLHYLKPFSTFIITSGLSLFYCGYIYTHLKLQNNHLLHSNSSFFIVFTHIYTHIHILYTKSHIQSRYQDLQLTNFPFPLSTIMDRLPATHIIYLSILIFLETVQKVLSSNLLRFYSCLFYYLFINMSLLEINYYYQKPTTCETQGQPINIPYIYISPCSILCPHYEYRITILIGV